MNSQGYFVVKTGLWVYDICSFYVSVRAIRINQDLKGNTLSSNQPAHDLQTYNMSYRVVFIQQITS